jgi:hypothetical protein
MEEHDVTPHELRELVERAEEAGYDLDAVIDETDRFDDLVELVEESQELAT